jgi:hypothetical protein
MTHVTGVPLMDVTRARDGWIWTCRHMRHPMALELSLRGPISIEWETVFCKTIKRLFTLRTTRWTWSPT